MSSGVGHESFSIYKLAGFVMIVLGVLFFNKILHFNWCLGEDDSESLDTALSLSGRSSTCQKPERLSQMIGSSGEENASTAADQESSNSEDKSRKTMNQVPMELSYNDSEDETGLLRDDQD